MPIYEYECASCHHRFDLIQKITDEPVKQCPVCFANSVTKLMSAVGFQLKGTGWYATDFKNKNMNADKSSKETNSGSESSSSESNVAKESTPASNETKTTKTTKSDGE